VIREIWRADERAQLRYPGEYYRLAGAKRGPAPAHEVPIWLGAYKPRMLRLVGAKADGWLPSLSYLKAGDLRTGNAIIDEAAAAAGRDPREIRRLLNFAGDPSMPAERWVDEIVALVVEDGVDTVILGTDDPLELQRFARRSSRRCARSAVRWPTCPRMRRRIRTARQTSRGSHSVHHRRDWTRPGRH
jgi:hypothetical protein